MFSSERPGASSIPASFRPSCATTPTATCRRSSRWCSARRARGSYGPCAQGSWEPWRQVGSPRPRSPWQTRAPPHPPWFMRVVLRHRPRRRADLPAPRADSLVHLRPPRRLLGPRPHLRRQPPRHPGLLARRARPGRPPRRPRSRPLAPRSRAPRPTPAPPGPLEPRRRRLRLRPPHPQPGRRLRRQPQRQPRLRRRRLRRQPQRQPRLRRRRPRRQPQRQPRLRRRRPRRRRRRRPHPRALHTRSHPRARPARRTTRSRPRA